MKPSARDCAESIRVLQARADCFIERRSLFDLTRDTTSRRPGSTSWRSCSRSRARRAPAAPVLPVARARSRAWWRSRLARRVALRRILRARAPRRKSSSHPCAARRPPRDPRAAFVVSAALAERNRDRERPAGPRTSSSATTPGALGDRARVAAWIDAHSIAIVARVQSQLFRPRSGRRRCGRWSVKPRPFGAREVRVLPAPFVLGA